MSSFLSQLSSFSLSNLLHLLGIFVVALFVNHLLKLLTKLIVKPAGTQSKTALAREQQTRTLSTVVYSAGSKVVWALALLVAAQEFGVNVTPVAAVAGLASLAVGFGAQNLVRDIISGFYIILEDQYGLGDTIQVADTIGRVEHLTLRRTVVRDPRGALVTLSNGDIRTVGNLSRDWSQAFVDVAVSPDVPQEHALQALDAAAAELRNDPAWSQALVDGPRILGLQSFDQHSSVIRLQLRTAPARHDDVARELRRRIQLQFQRQGIALSNVRRVELVKPSGSPLADSPAPPA
ncbi:MAG TPA: mechanosensitive ion channel family protein [Methylomirabilota bacterium]|nr:mechanosensitive ion channel family protein [Methylomirabilota bacterium]